MDFWEDKQEGLLFLKKKEAKRLLSISVRAVANGEAKRIEVLWFFLSRKNQTSLSLPCGKTSKSP
jgi:hypothetical protein